MRIARSSRALPAAVAPVAAALALVAAGLLAGGPAAASEGVPAGDAVPLVEGVTTTARLDVPYPGRSTSFEVLARSTSAAPSDLALVVDGGTGPLASGPDGLRLVLTDDGGRVLAAGTPAELAAAPVDLGAIGAEPVTVRATATLPATAGDELQGVGLTLRLGLVAAQEVPGPPDPGPGGVARGVLAVTGGGVLLPALAAAVLAAAGLLALAARRRRRTQEEDA